MPSVSKEIKLLNEALRNIVGIQFVNIADHPNTLVFPSPPPHRCSVCLEVMRPPKFVYHDLGEFLVAYDELTGFMHSYHYMRGTKDGFAGREITLPIVGGSVFRKKGQTKKTYKGSLWTSAEGKAACEEYFGLNSVCVAYKERRKINSCGTSAEINKHVFNKKMNMTGFMNLGGQNQ
ncbi:hypothetical protein [Kiloniella litopenaei]|uniref:hypothetical protein n=1 Tax=Kiloniella litopenaei TaxID=1549748 RepID=UPI003BAA3644